MKHILLPMFLSAQVLSGQYSWTTSTTTMPPPDPPMESLENYTAGYTGSLAWTATGSEGGEVRTTIVRTASGVSGQYSYEHLLGWRKEYDYNLGRDQWSGYIVRIYECQPCYITPRATILRLTWSNGSPVYTQLAQYSIGALGHGTVFSSSIRQSDGGSGQGAGIHLRFGNATIYYRATDLLVGTRHGAGRAMGWTESYSEIRVGPLETVSPFAVSNLAAPVSNGVMNASWTAAADDFNGIGVAGYEVYQNGALLGTTSGTSWSMPVAAGQSFPLAVRAFDGHRNFGPNTTITVTGPSPVVGGELIDDSLRTGVHPLGTHWGAMGEAIDARSMNLNYTVPLLKAQGRAGLGLGISLSYNSQNWRKQGTTVSKPGADVGYGFGWRLSAGSLFPFFSSPTTLAYFIFTDATGAQYRLDQNNGNIWTTKEGIQVWFDASTYRLYFTDGTFWEFGSVAAGTEQDAGTRYPTLVQDRNGNQLQISYRPGIGAGPLNTSARIGQIFDVRGTAASAWATYTFSYNTDAIPHLTGIVNHINTAESYSFTYSSLIALYEPFANSQQFGSAVRLNSLVQNGVGLTTQFQYNSSAEMTKLTFPLGGEMMWNYTTQSYANGRQAREVLSRDLRKSAGAATVSYVFSHPTGSSGLKYHAETTLADPSAVGQRRWSFFTSADFKQGLPWKYEELENWAVKTRAESSWTSYVGRPPQVTEVVTTVDVGQSYQRQVSRRQTYDNYGNVLTTQVSPCNNLTGVARSTSCTYTANQASYVARYIVSIPWSCSVSDPTGNYLTPSIGLDASALSSVPSDIRLWVNPNSSVRGNVTSVWDGFLNQSATYNLAGQPVSQADGQGLSYQVVYGGVGGSTVPVQMTPNGNTGLQVNLAWNGFLGLTSTSTGNGASQSFGYDAYARPSTEVSPYGATTTFGYSPGTLSSTATVGARTLTTRYDGLGRTVQVETAAAGTVTTVVDTEYEPCACSPVGKVKRVSLPHAPGATVYWTVFTYDGLGRTLSVAQPNGVSDRTHPLQFRPVTWFTVIGNQDWA